MSLATQRARFLVKNLDLARATGVEGAEWEAFQLAHLSDDSLFRIEVKSRQIAWSWLCAAEAVAQAVLPCRQSSIFVSINQDEAKEKIRYARQILESIEGIALPRLVRDNELGIELSNGARLLSLPATPPRGKARFRVYLDEFAHVARDREIYTAVLPVISKGGCVRIGSSPLGASGMFWEIFGQQIQAYPGYARKQTPWWEAAAFCVNVRAARKLAPAMATAVRVDAFGTDRIEAIYANLPEEDFRQEYEAEFVDESTAWISWEEIKQSHDPDLACPIATARDGQIQAATQAIDELRKLIDAGKAESTLAAGVDVGRTRNATELLAVGCSTTGSFPLRLMVTLDALPFEDQLTVIEYALERLPIVQLYIDRNGIGRNLSENLESRFPSKVAGQNFATQTKALWATDAKMLIQQHKTPLPVSRDLDYQIHSVKRIVTPSKNLVFDTARNERHHADKFWGWALSLAAARAPQRQAMAEVW